MPAKPLQIMCLAIPFLLSACASTRIPGKLPLPKQAPLDPDQTIPAPDPLLAYKCLQEALVRVPMSAPNSEPSCKALRSWLSKFPSGNDAQE